MTDKDVVYAFRDWLGHGNVRTEQPKGNCKLAYVIKVGKQDVVRRALSNMLPYFGTRRAHKALDVLDDLELTK